MSTAYQAMRTDMFPTVLFVMPNWLTPSEVFLYRQRQMLYDAGMLAGIVVTSKVPPVDRWQDVPVYTPLLPDRVGQSRLYKFSRALKHKLRLPVENNVDRMQRILQKSQPDVILCQYATTAVEYAHAFRSCNSRLFIHVHGYDVQHGIYKENRLPVLHQLSETAIIICNSHWTYQHMQQLGIAKDRLHFKYFGVELPAQPPVYRDVEEVTILYLGRLIDFKSPDRVIEVFNIACEAGLCGRLIIAGDGPMRARCEALREQSPYRERIAMIGAVSREEGDRLRAKADIFLHHGIVGESSEQIEAFGVSIVEAMAAGLPVVATRFGGIMESVVDGETGILVEPGDVQGQAAALLRLAQDVDLRRVMGQAGRQRVANHFTLAHERQRLMDILTGT